MCDGTLRRRSARSTPVSKPGNIFFRRGRDVGGSKFVSTAAEDEAPMDHIMETYSGVDATFQESS